MCCGCIRLVLFFVRIVLLILFFFKQKTAYEMRISDWSSDVCSSDLENKFGMDDFERKGTRELTADDYVYGFRRLASPRVVSPIYGEIGRASCRERVCQYV